jgi:molybdate transport system substrate-binding protein
MMNKIFAVLAFASALAACRSDPAAVTVPPSIKVAAAADLAFAFRDLGAVFETKSGIKTVFSFGSTGLLAKQIKEGAPFDVFAAANVSFADDVAKSGACDASTKSLYARGRIVLWTKKDTAHPEKLADLADPRFVKIAIANPEHAPYGRAAEEALKTAGLWETVKPRMVFGENVQQTLQFAESGNVEAAIVALSLAMVSETGRHTLIDDALHKAIDQAMVVCSKESRDAALRFTDFVSSEEGRAIMRRYGFLLPGESIATAR